MDEHVRSSNIAPVGKSSLFHSRQQPGVDGAWDALRRPQVQGFGRAAQRGVLGMPTASRHRSPIAPERVDRTGSAAPRARRLRQNLPICSITQDCSGISPQGEMRRIGHHAPTHLREPIQRLSRRSASFTGLRFLIMLPPEIRAYLLPPSPS